MEREIYNKIVKAANIISSKRTASANYIHIQIDEPKKDEKRILNVKEWLVKKNINKRLKNYVGLSNEKRITEQIAKDLEEILGEEIEKEWKKKNLR